ncbi:hypothetical protein [Vallitalea okinawensis]|uniref:hypothetical protein n=1 Tax=Vallitalea okinawensis TaxID=2078660 RepID=UPI000CFBFD28|nr:hypothetical protein [Vallitalea okinawensis]
MRINKVIIYPFSILIITVIVIYIFNAVEDKRFMEELSLLHPKQIENYIRLSESIKINDLEFGGDIFQNSKEDLLSSLSLDEWKKKRVSSPNELSADIRIEIDENYRVYLYETVPLAMVLYKDEWRYYKISQSIHRNVSDWLYSVTK